MIADCSRRAGTRCPVFTDLPWHGYLGPFVVGAMVTFSCVRPMFGMVT